MWRSHHYHTTLVVLRIDIVVQGQTHIQNGTELVENFDRFLSIGSSEVLQVKVEESLEFGEQGRVLLCQGHTQDVLQTAGCAVPLVGLCVK